MAVQKSKLRVAIITDWLFSIRGSEKVLDAICEIFPQSEIYSLFGNTQEIYKLPNVRNKVIHYSWLNKLPFIFSFYRYTYPIWPAIVEGYKFKDFDLIISISSSVAKGILPKNTPHLCYMNTPMRYAWDMRFKYFKNNPLSFLIQPFLHYLRIWDSTRNNTIDYLISNSKFTAQRVFKYYGRVVDQVVYPFFDNQGAKSNTAQARSFYLYHGALEPNKGVLEAVKSAIKYSLPLKVSGTGSLYMRIKNIAKGYSNIEILGWVDDKTKYALMSKAKLLLFPSIEDFGIVALEANSVGTPVLCLKESGTGEIIKDKVNGVVINNQSEDEIYQAIIRAKDIKWNSKIITQSTSKFSRDIFQQSILKAVKSITM